MKVAGTSVENGSVLWRWERFAGPLCFLGCILAVVFVSFRSGAGDLNQFLGAMNAVSEGKWDQIYPNDSLATSMSGWIAIITFPFLFFRTTLDSYDAFVASGIVALPLFFVSFRFAFRSFWPDRSFAEAWILALVAVWLPTTLAAWVEYYHPQDVAGAALILFAAGFAVRSRWGISGLFFGFAVMTRQWALLAAIPIAALSGKEIWKFISGAALGSALLLLPIIATGNEGWFEVLAFRPSKTGANSALGGLSVYFSDNSNKPVSELVINLSRWIPLFLSAAVGVFVYWKSKMRGYVWPKQTIIVLCIYGVALRNMFELFSFAYYWLPVAPLLLILTPRRKTNWVFVLLFGVIPPVLSYILPWGFTSQGTVLSWHTIVWYFILSLAALTVPWHSIKPETPDSTVDDSVTIVVEKPKAPKLAWVFVCMVSLGVVLGIYQEKIPTNSSEVWKNVKASEAEERNKVIEDLRLEGIDPFTVIPIEEGNMPTIADIGSKP